MIHKIKIANNENKLKFFAQYFGQRVLKNKKSPETTILNGHFFYHSVPYLVNYHLELRSIDSITDKEVCEFYVYESEQLKCDDYSISFIEELKDNSFMCSNRIDFLRSKSFLVPFMNLTTDQILDFGWAKIKDK